MTAAAAGAPPDAAAQLVDAAVGRLTEGDAAAGEQLLRQALEADSRNLGALRVLAQLQRNLGRHAEAAAIYEALLTLAPADADVHFGRASALLATNRAQEALPSLDHVTWAAPDFAPGHHSRGVALSVLRRFGEALPCFDRALQLEPNEPGTLNNRGVALQELRRLPEALQSFDTALRLNPDYPAALGNRGAVLRELGRHAESFASCQRALQLNPGEVSALNNLGSALHELRRLPEAAMAFRQVLGAQPNHVAALNNLASVLSELGRPEEALALYDRALELAPKAVSSLDNLGLLLNELGRRDEAIAAFDRAIELAPRRARTYYNLTLAHDFTPEDRRLQAMEALASDPVGLSPDEMVELNYGLGRAYTGLGDVARAFERFAEGAERKRNLIGYDERSEIDLLARTAHAFSVEAVWRGQGLGDPSDLPVFIVGMPRSGSTLVEQILAMHPRAFAAGEIADFGEVMAAIRSPAKEALAFPEDYASLHGPALRRAGGAYVERVRARAPQAARIVNKSLVNYRLLGFIHLALPGARIIHVRRDPRDTCLSCFTQLFQRDHQYTYDLAELGRYYRAYEALMDHWQDALTEGVLLEVDYEEVVADLEGQARRIVDHVGLAWDPACLDFHRAQRQLRTASVTQARQPLYASSIGRWKDYGPWLGPLEQALQGRQV